MKNLGTLLVSFLFTSSIIAASVNTITTDNDDQTTTSIEATTQKKAGQVVYNCGSSPCEGVKKAFHDNGQLQISGTFKNGVIVIPNINCFEYKTDLIFCLRKKSKSTASTRGSSIGILIIFSRKSNPVPSSIWMSSKTKSGGEAMIFRYASVTPLASPMISTCGQ